VPFTIRDESEVADGHQAGVYQTDYDIIVAGSAGTGVITGCAVAAQGSPDMTVAVAAGTVRVAGAAAVAVAAGNVAITADATNPRFALVVVDGAGAKSAVAGTADPDPLVPDLPANSVALATIWVEANDTAIGATQITDKRVILGNSPPPDVVTTLATNFYTTEPQNMLVLQGSFVATTTRPRIRVEVACQTTGIQHALWQLLVGPGIAFPLHSGTVSGPISGVTAHDLGPVAGENGRGKVVAEIWPTGITVGQTVRWQLMAGVVGYGGLVTGLAGTNVRARVMPNNKKLYAISGSKIVPIVLGRTLENYPNAAIAGEYLSAVPYVTGGAADVAFKADSTRAYVSDWFGAVPGVVVIDTATDRVLTKVTGFSPIGMAMCQDSTKLFVCTGGGAGAIKIIDTTTHAVTTQSLASTSVLSAYCKISPDGTKLAVATSGGGGVTNRVYVYTVGTGGTTWTLLATCVVGGVDTFPGPLAWEGNNVVWVPYTTMNVVCRCQVDTQQVSSFATTNAQSCSVTGKGLGTSLFVGSPDHADRMCYYVLPSTHGVAPTKFDGHNLYDVYDITLSDDDFIYQGTDDGRIYINQGGQIWVRANAASGVFWGEGATVSVSGGTP
jgi:hypothetical protein